MNRRWLLHSLILLVLLLLYVLPGCVAAPGNPLDTAWWTDQPAPGKQYRGVVKRSLYLPMRDGVRIAADVYLPKNLGPADKLPTIVSQTRYWRSVHVYFPIPLYKEIDRIVEHGYALVRIDVRGSGASFGSIPYPWSPDEVRDGAEVVDWIIRQPWSNGKVGAAGGSYEGTTAEFLLTTQHPNVLAVAPAFALFDVYADVAFPGGIQLEWFTRLWQQGNRIMDNNRPQDFEWYLPLLTSGVNRVDEDVDGTLLQQAIRDHANNINVHEAARELTYRDDVSSGGFSPDRFSPHSFIAALQATGKPIYSYSGWMDGAYSHAAIKRWLTVKTPGSRLLLGPWDHGGDDQYRPFDKPVKAKFDHYGELLRFFDYYLKDAPNGLAAEAPVRYFTLVDDVWKAAENWPPPADATTYFFRDQHSLDRAAPAEAAADEYQVDLTARTGGQARWNSLGEAVAVQYPNRAEQDRKLLCYNSGPLPADMEVTGHPYVVLYISSTATDGTFFVYLEDVDERGRISFVTEGQLRALHRRLSDATPPYRSPVPFYRTFLRADAQPLVPGEVAELKFDLLPVSYVFRRGHSLRVALAGADADHFLQLGGAPTIRVYRGGAHASGIVLPVVKRTRD